MRLIRAFTVLAALSAAGFGQCPNGNVLSLSVQGGRLGDPFSVSLLGAPNVSGLLGVDVASGTYPTPIGNVCLGLTTNLQILPFTLDSGGQFTLTGTIPLQPALTGTAAYLQAGAIDPAQPGGSTLSNSQTVPFRPPRLFLISKGYEGASAPYTPGAWCSLNAINDSILVPPVTLPGVARDAVLVPSLGWIAFLCGNLNIAASIECYDAGTGVLALTIPLAPTSAPSKLALVGTTLYVLRSNPPGGIDGYALPSGTPGVSVSLTTPATPYAMIIEPVSRTAYLHSSNTASPAVGPKPIFVIDLLNGVQLPSISGALNDPDDWLIVGTTLYLQWQVFNFFPAAEAAIQAIDTTTNLPLQAPVVLPLSGNGSRLRYGPGSFGNSLFLTCANYFPPLIEIHPQTLQPVTQVPGSLPFVYEMVPSSGGTEWLMIASPVSPIFYVTSFKLQALSVPSLTMTTVAMLPIVPVMAAVRNATLHKAVLIDPTSQVKPFGTDPSTPPGPGFFLPMPPITRVLVD
jgi:hypothetical protein